MRTVTPSYPMLGPSSAISEFGAQNVGEQAYIELVACFHVLEPTGRCPSLPALPCAHLLREPKNNDVEGPLRQFLSRNAHCSPSETREYATEPRIQGPALSTVDHRYVFLGVLQSHSPAYMRAYSSADRLIMSSCVSSRR
jgi:hypothetical protein